MDPPSKTRNRIRLDMGAVYPKMSGLALSLLSLSPQNPLLVVLQVQFPQLFQLQLG